MRRSKDQRDASEKTIVQIDDENFGITLTFEHNPKMFQQVEKNLFCIVLDISGSMSGKSSRNAKDAIISLLYGLKKLRCDVLFFTFSTQCSVIDFTNLNLEKRIDIVKSVKCSGNTSFYSVFREMRTVITAKQAEMRVKDSKIGKCSTIFFTDGVENVDKEHRVQEQYNLLTDMRMKTNVFEFHCIGFTKAHDAKFLVRLTEQGNVVGSFQYVEVAKDIKNAIYNISNLLNFEEYRTFLKVDSSEYPFKKAIFFRELRSGDYQTTFYTSKKVLSYKLFIEFENFDYPLVFPDDEDMSLKGEKKIKVFLDYYRARVLEFTTTIVAMKGSEFMFRDVLQVNNEIRELDEKLTLLMDRIRETVENRQLQRDFFRQVHELKNVFESFYSILMPYLNKEVSKSISNQTIAQLNSLAYAERTKKSFKKKMNVRINANIVKFSQLEKKVEIFDCQLEAESANPVKEIEDNLCFISCKNYLDCLEDKDIFCVGVNIKRDRNSIMNPTKVKIMSISPQFITLDTFLETLVYNSKNIKKNEKKKLMDSSSQVKRATFAKTETREKFLTKDNLYIKGIGEDLINGIFPLFISKVHWELAKLKYPAGMGFTITGDPCGYTYNQMLNFPYMILTKAFLDKGKSEFKMQQYKFIKQSCDHYFQEYKLAEETLKLFLDYFTSPICRTADIIPKIDIFLGKLLCLLTCEGETKEKVKIQNFVDKKKIMQLLKFMSEEELRRAQKFRGAGAKFQKIYFAILNLDLSIKIQDFSIANIMSEEGSLVEAMEKFKKFKEMKEPLSETQRTVIAGMEKQFVKEVVPYLNMVIEMFAVEELKVSKFDDLVLSLKDENERNIMKLGLIIQNLQTVKNQTRRKFFADKKYLDPFKSYREIVEVRIEKILDKRKKKIASLRSLAGKSISDTVKEFALTPDLNKAASILQKIKLDSHDFNCCVIMLQEHECKMPLEKIEMLITGKFGFVNLFCNQKKSPKDIIRWSPSRKNIFRLWRNNKKHFNVQIAVKLFGKIEKVDSAKRALHYRRQKRIQTKKWSSGGCEQYFLYRYSKGGRNEEENMKRTAQKRKKIGH